jgi:O-antigen ligase
VRLFRREGSVSGLVWTVGVYLGTALVAWRFRLITPQSADDRRVLVALLLVLAGAHSTAVRTGAEDVAANPVVLETVLRGCCDVLALAVILPVAARTSWQFVLTGSPGAVSLVAYLAAAAISTLYSAAPIVTAGKAFELGVGLLLVLVVTGQGPEEAVSHLRALVRAIVVFEAGLLIVALVGFVLMPQTFSQIETRPGFILPRTLGSPYAHSNGLSSMAALVSVYAFAELLTDTLGKHRRLWTTLACLGVLGVLLASGRQGVVMWVAAMAVLLLVCRRRWFVLLLAPTAIAVGVIYRDAILAALSRGQQSVTLVTWSGRLNFWRAALDVWSQHPWLGYGFGAGGRFVALKSIGSDASGSLHSGYLEALTGVGALGVIPLAVALVLVTVWAVRALRERRQVPLAILLIPLLLRTFVSEGFAAWLDTEFLIFAALTLTADAERKTVRTARLSVGTEPGELAQHRLP